MKNLKISQLISINKKSSSECCDQTTASASTGCHSPTLTAASRLCIHYQRNTSQVKVNSEAHNVWWWPIVVVIISCDATQKHHF